MKKKYPLYILSVLSCVYLLISCFKTPTQHISTKIKGVSVVGAPKEIENTSFTEIININSNYVALIPYAFVPKTEASVITNHGYQWWGETPEGIIKCIKMADSLHLKVMIKPQLWFAHGEYTGNINFSSEKEWLQWEKHYTEYIMRFVKLANDWNVELFCIGTELKRAVENRPDFWINLISKIRKSYNGKLTYAANWDEYEDLIFWNKLDFIGIDAYFPLCQKKCNYSSLINQWRSISNRLEKFSAKIQRPIL
ncbi:MAG: glycoside hydrolase family 113, partial [Bacteroidia bacterium]